MHHTSAQKGYGYIDTSALWQDSPPASISCDWPSLRMQLLTQWDRLTPRELDKAGQNRHLIAMLIEKKYGIHSRVVENYLRNFERTMPLRAQVNLI